jgi:adenylate cyclase
LQAPRCRRRTSLLAVFDNDRNLGRDAGGSVASPNRPRRLDRIKTVLRFNGLRNYTRMSDRAPSEEIIPLLNDYADALVSTIRQHSGDVLKLIDDGLLAIFPDRGSSPRVRRHTRRSSGRASVARNPQRTPRPEGLPTTDMYLGLHLGVVFYGNIGSKERLDFTVVGPAVNEVAGIAALCRAVDQPILMSSAFAASVDEDRRRFASVGRSLRGVGEPQELYTLDVQG